MPGFQRVVEVVYRPLEKLASSAPFYNLKATKEVLGHQAIPNAKPKLPSLVSHWAVRIEAWDTDLDHEYIGGDETTHWHYLGLANDQDAHPENPTLCTLDYAAWQSLGNTKNYLRGWTSWSLDEFYSVAYDIIKEWGDYDLTGNNCQDYAITFFTQVVDFIEHQDRVLEQLFSLRLNGRLINVETDHTGMKTVKNRQGTVVLRSISSGQNPDLKAAVSTGESEILMANPWVWDDRYQKYRRWGGEGVEWIWHC